MPVRLGLVGLTQLIVIVACAGSQTDTPKPLDAVVGEVVPTEVHAPAVGFIVPTKVPALAAAIAADCQNFLSDGSINGQYGDNIDQTRDPSM